MHKQHNQLEPINSHSEKSLSIMFNTYHNAMQMFQQQSFPEGVNVLNQLLAHPLIDDPDMQQLKYSCYISLAEVYLMNSQQVEGLGYYYKAHIILDSKESQVKGKVKSTNDQTLSDQFTLLMKMITLTDSLKLVDQTIHLLKKAIKISPTIWREELLKKLKILYELNGNHEALEDLLILMRDQPKLQTYLNENEEKAVEEGFGVEVQLERQCEPLQKIKIVVNLSQKGQQEQKYSNWETILTISYVLLKCQSERNFSKKKYLHKKYDQSNRKWNHFLKEYDISKTEIQFIFIEDEQEPLDQKDSKSSFHSKMQSDHKIDQEIDRETQAGTLVFNLAKQLLKNEHLKKKNKKVFPKNQELTKNIILKDNKKQMPKSVYSSIWQYYKQTLKKNDFNREYLAYMKFYNEEIYTEILEKIEKDEIIQIKKVNAQDMENEDDSEADNTISQGNSLKNVQNQAEIRPRKDAKTRKLESIGRHKALNERLKQFFQISTNKMFDDNSVVFNNIIDFLQHVCYRLLDERDENGNINRQILSHEAIKKLLIKNIVKILSISQRFFQKCYYIEEGKLLPEHLMEPVGSQRNYFLQMLINKIEELSAKEYRNKPFKMHQEKKINRLVGFIHENYDIKITQYEELLQMSQQDALENLMKLCHQMMEFNCLYYNNRPNEANYYKDMYVQSKQLKRKMKPEQLQMGNEDQESSQAHLENQLQTQIAHFANIRHQKARLENVTEEHQQTTKTIDQLLKKDQDASSVNDLLGVFNCGSTSLPKLSNATANSQQQSMMEEGNGRGYLLCFIKLMKVYFLKLETSGGKEFNSRNIQAISEFMKIKGVIGDIYDKFLQNSTLKTGEIQPTVLIRTLFYLIRIYFLNAYEENDNSLRIIFYITSILLRQYDENIKFIAIPKTICFYDHLIRFKKFKHQKPDVLKVVRKKLYLNIIIKNIHFIYNSPIFQIKPDSEKHKAKESQMEPEENGQKGKPFNFTKNQNESIFLHAENQELTTEYEQIRQKIFEIFNEIYYTTEKDQEFNPKKIDDTIGYFMYLSRANYEQFHCKSVELSNQVCKIFKKCYKIYQEKRNEIYEHCYEFNQFLKLFEKIMNGQQNDTEQFTKIVEMKNAICECCPKLNQTNQFYVEALFIIGKYFESKPYLQESDKSLAGKQTESSQQSSQQGQLQLNNLDEKYYMEYLVLNLRKQSAWENVIRINCTKTHLYFDSLIGDALQKLKNKFLFTKRIILYAMNNLKMKKLNQEALAELEVLNTLKIREREYNMVLKDIEMFGVGPNKQSKELTKKYKEGLKKLLSVVSKSPSQDLRVKYIRIIEIKMRLAWIMIEKEHREEDKINQHFIELDEMMPDQKQYKPSKHNNGVNELIKDVNQLSAEIKQKSNLDQELTHLQQDLIVELYVFLFRDLEEKVERIIGRLIQVIRVSSKTDQCRKLKDMQYTFNQLEFLVNLFKEPDFATREDKYRFRRQRLAISKSELNYYQSMFISTFAPKKQQIKGKPKESLSQILVEKYGKPKSKNDNVVDLEDEETQRKMRQKRLQTVNLLDEDDEPPPPPPKPQQQNRTFSNQSCEDLDEPEIPEEEQKSFKIQEMPDENQNNDDERQPSFDNENSKPLSQGSASNKNLNMNEVVIDVSKYFYSRLRKYMDSNEDAAKRFNCIHSVVGSLSFKQILLRMTKIISELMRVFLSIPRYQQKRYRNRRSVTSSMLACSQIIQRYGNNPMKANQIIKDYYNIKTDDIVFINFHNDKKSTERNSLLAEFYDRSIVHQLMKIKFIEHLFRLFVDMNQKENIIILIRRLLKISKNANAGLQYTGIVNKNNQPSIGVVAKLEANVLPEEKDKIKDTINKEEKEKEVKSYYLLFCEGVSYLIDILKKESMIKEIQEKYQKNLLEFKNRIKKSLPKDKPSKDKEESNYYLDKIEDFMSKYQEKYSKKIKMKKSKKQLQMAKQAKLKGQQEIKKQIKFQEFTPKAYLKNKSRSKSKSKSASGSKSHSKSKSDRSDNKKSKKSKKVKKSKRKKQKRPRSPFGN